MFQAREQKNAPRAKNAPCVRFVWVDREQIIFQARDQKLLQQSQVDSRTIQVSTV